MTTTERLEWRDRALCRNRDPELYVVDGVANNQRQKHAREVCFGCPVIIECAEEALRNNDTEVVRAAKALPACARRGKRMLLNIKGVTRPAPRPRTTNPDWSVASCRECGFRLRPRGALAAEYPNSREACSATQCASCRRAERRAAGEKKKPSALTPYVSPPHNSDWDDKQCAECSRYLRPSHAHASDYPDTAPATNMALCQSCYRATKRAKNRVGAA